jgi:hypothetical protein
MSKVIDSEGNIKVSGLGSVISQTITDGVVDKAPSEDAVFDALATKLDINALPSNLVLYPTNVASDILGYFKMVTSQDDPSYNVTAIDFVTPAITTTSQLVGSVATTVGVLSGNPGILPNVGTIGNIKRNSGSGNATFYFEVYHRNLAGTETLIGTSNQTTSVTSSSYVEFEAFVIWNNGTFLPTDRIVIKYLANRVGSGSDPVYSFQFGGLTPTRTIVPVPASVLLNVPIQVGVTQIVDGTNGRVIYDDNGVIGEVEVDSTPTLLSANLVSSGGVATSLTNKQDTLVSATNIKTINGNSLLGSGDLVISGGGGGIEVGTTAVTSGTIGRVFFQGTGDVVQQDAVFVFNPTTKAFGVGTSSPSGIINGVSGVSSLLFSTGAGSVTPTLSVANTNASGKAVAFACGVGASVLAYSTNGAFLVMGETKANIAANSVGGGTVFARFETDGKLAIGANAAGAKLDVQAQGALSTDIAFRVRNSADTQNSFVIDGLGQGRIKSTSYTPKFSISYNWAGGERDAFVFTQNIQNSRGQAWTFDAGYNGAFEGLQISNDLSGNNKGQFTIQLNNFCFGTNMLNNDIGTAERRVLRIASGVAPTTSKADEIKFYSADIVAGNAAPHFRTENGNIIKLYQQSSAGITTVADLVTVLTNLGLLA